MTSTTTLPKISPISTPVPSLQKSVTSLYGPYPPKELSATLSLIRIPPRINPLAPNPPKRRINDSWETIEQHYHNEKRRILMQRMENQRYHSAWSRGYYGSPAEKEQYRKHYREVLKQQMADHDADKVTTFKEKVRESQQSIAYDNDCKRKDAEAHVKKHVYLQNFRDGNKELMERKWTEHRSSKYLEDRIDRERLRYNPINWSCSLK